ncbi:glycosyltransferase [Micromonospora yangpuensis]|uniref:Glycosyl transferases group 1 n=1 Tax=Micromonospora yangpuensis TaxID=683228 RepID=A0A1C6U8U8_9ACTN|nr:glycosyltransferase [Micromonospora yangpuensis]GGL89091.1 hypothetical protein GCM10012279_03360 [Micromonospora yangpuensis]SCL50432.1 Glycosyl transferases group 1 [Micromonospora yangpuensis]
MPAVDTTVVECSGVGDGGITRVLTEIVRHWPGPHRLRVVAAPPGWSAPATGPGVTVEVLSHQGGGRARTIAAATAGLRAVTGRADGTTRVLSLSPSLAVRGSRLPVTTVLHDLAFRLWPHGLSAPVRQYRRVSYATAIGRSARLLCVSARTRHDLFGLYGVPADRTALWQPGSSLDPPTGGLPAPLAAADRPYLVVAGHAAHKGVEIAVEALPELPGYLLAVLTGGQRFPHHTAARSAAADRVVLLDRLTDDGYAATLAGAAALLMPSHFEGYGLPAVEALRLGTPVVVSPDPALHEATGGRAARMLTWTPQALVAAVAEATSRPVPTVVAGRTGPLAPAVVEPTGRPAPVVGPVGRSWAEATAHLVELLADAAPATPDGR